MRQELVPERVPIEEDPMGPAEKSRSVDDVGEIALDRFDQPEVLLRIILEVGVLDNDDASPHLLKASTQRSTLPAVRRLKANHHIPDGKPIAGLRKERGLEAGRDVGGDLLE